MVCSDMAVKIFDKVLMRLVCKPSPMDNYVMPTPGSTIVKGVAEYLEHRVNDDTVNRSRYTAPLWDKQYTLRIQLRRFYRQNMRSMVLERAVNLAGPGPLPNYWKESSNKTQWRLPQYTESATIR